METPKYFDPILEGENEDLDRYRDPTIRHLAANGFPVKKDVRIYRLRYQLRGEEVVAQVGENHRRPGGDFVEFIFESDAQKGLYLITGPYSGVMTGSPALVGPDMSPSALHFAR